MKPHQQPAASLVLLILLANMMTAACEPIIATSAFVVGLFATAWYGTFCYFNECCQPDWISFNRKGLEADLKRKLLGQHIASRVILKAVSGFMNDDNRKKPLVLSLHGLAGTGKTFVSKLIANNIYKEGMDSKFVHFSNAAHHFPHASLIHTYKSQLRDQIRNSVSGCQTSMFIFDEADKMPPGLIDSITTFLDYYDKLDGVSYRKAIFIFLSNTGGSSIVETTLDFWKSGRDREEIELKDLEMPLSLAVFNNKQSGYTSLIEKNLVDFFVPFLPLEHKHVVLCAKAEMVARGLPPDQDVAEKVAKELIYFPTSEEAFSVKGCKTVQGKLDYHL